MSGENKSLAGAAVRAAMSIAEPIYSAVMIARNLGFDRGLFRSHDLGRPTISVGNITTGGTGKTPVVQWLANELRRRGRRPAILLRGYGASTGQTSDEAALLCESLKIDPQIVIPVKANPSRVAGSAEVLWADASVDRFILDDGFQHRGAKRNFDLVLISATNPFGYGHVLPRGLLREPLRGLGRANAFLITRCSLVPPDALALIERYLAASHPAIPVFHCDHQHAGIAFAGRDDLTPMSLLTGQKVFLTAAIGDPASFQQQITASGCDITGCQWFADHHAFTAVELRDMLTAAKHSNAECVLTTEKDWMKIKSLLAAATMELPIGIVKMEIQFSGDDAVKLIDLISVGGEGFEPPTSSV